MIEEAYHRIAGIGRKSGQHRRHEKVPSAAGAESASPVRDMAPAATAGVRRRYKHVRDERTRRRRRTHHHHSSIVVGTMPEPIPVRYFLLFPNFQLQPSIDPSLWLGWGRAQTHPMSFLPCGSYRLGSGAALVALRLELSCLNPSLGRYLGEV